ncbi:MAG: lipocalin family protein [Gammaproteobacteria bacterium]|nr:lipocalin family protein [Gammaproteobacteria bacterium]
MKYISLITIFTTVLVFLCNAKEPTYITGTWFLYSVTVQGSVNIIDYDEIFRHDLCKKRHYVDFSDNTFRQAKIDFHECREQFTVTGTYTINDNLLTLTPQFTSLFEETPSPIQAHDFVITFSLENEKLTLTEEGTAKEYRKVTTQ